MAEEVNASDSESEFQSLGTQTSGENHEIHDINYHVNQLIGLLQNEIRPEEWNAILSKYGYKIDLNLDFNKLFKFCLKREIITKDLDNLKYNLRIIKKYDLAEKLSNFDSIFSKISDSQFREIFKDKAIDEIDPELWKASLQKYIFFQHSKVEPILATSKMVNLDEIYTPLTVIEHEPNKGFAGANDAETELDILLKIRKNSVEYRGKCTTYITSNKHQLKSDKNSLINVILSEKLIEVMLDSGHVCQEFRSVQEGSLCIIGNPGSGKTFLCSRIALLYGQDRLQQFNYCLSIPCRNGDWHSLEISREKRKQSLTDDFIQAWLRLGMRQDTKWSEDLSQHIVKTDGEGLLIIIDSLDEFTKDIPFAETLLACLLQRKCLPKSTIIVTSRPGAWYDITTNFKVNIESYLHVLGFSEKNRDIYFEFVLDDDSKLKECKKLFQFHQDIALLSLIPVNASYFAYLFKSTISYTTYTLTQLFSLLLLYLIRRQLSRMGLVEYISVETLEELDEGILKCLYNIGEVAYKGVALRETTSTQKFKLKMEGKTMRDSEWLGLVNVRIKEREDGKKIKVWSFSHFTMQEFVAAVWLSSNKWYNICLVARYIVSTEEVFSIFKMIFRFTCGILLDSAIPILDILFHYQLDTPLEFRNLPLCQQLCYEDISGIDEVFHQSDALFEISDMEMFMKKFLSMISFFIEINSKCSNATRQPPKDSSFYIRSKIDPGEWLNFTKSLKYLVRINIIYFESEFISPEELELLLQHLGECQLQLLAIRFTEKTFEDISHYTETMTKSGLHNNTKVCFDLIKCDLSKCKSSSELFSFCGQHSCSSIRLYQNTLSDQGLQTLTELSSLTNLYFHPEQRFHEYPLLLPLLKNIPKIQGLHLDDIPDEIFELVLQILPDLSSLEEVTFDSSEAYSVLPRLFSLHKLTYLSIRGYPEEYSNLSKELLDLIEKNGSYLKIIKLYHLETIGFECLNPLFKSLSFCENLARVSLVDCKLTFDDTVPITEMKMPQFLNCLEMMNVSLQDTGLLILIQTVPFHKALRYLRIYDCYLSSDSCISLCRLISTLKQLRKLEVSEKELSQPDSDQYKLVKQACEQLTPSLIRLPSV